MRSINLGRGAIWDHLQFRVLHYIGFTFKIERVGHLDSGGQSGFKPRIYYIQDLYV